MNMCFHQKNILFILNSTYGFAFAYPTGRRDHSLHTECMFLSKFHSVGMGHFNNLSKIVIN